MDTEFVHPKIGEEIVAISGRYQVIKEGLLSYDEREVLYLIGFAAFDSSCCGEGGCGYALVAGFVNALRAREHESGAKISLVAPIIDESPRKEIEALLMANEFVNQVNFM